MLPNRRALVFPASVFLLALSSCTGAAPQPTATPAPPRTDSRPTFITPDGKSTRPFSPAVRVGNTLYLSGQIGLDASGQLVAGGIEAETRRVLENIKAVLEKSGSSMDRVVKCTVMMVDMAEWERMNSVYVTYFPGNKPARSAFGTSGLALGARVEIECIAAVD